MRTCVAVSRRAGSVTRRRRMTFLVSSLTRPSSGIVNSAVLILLNSSWNRQCDWILLLTYKKRPGNRDVGMGTLTKYRKLNAVSFISASSKVPPSSVADPDPELDPYVLAFLGSWIYLFEVQIRMRHRILLSSSKNCKKNLDCYCFVTSLWLFNFEEWCKCSFKKY